MAISGTSRRRLTPGISFSRSVISATRVSQSSPLGVMVDREESLDGGQQADDFFLADFHPAADAHVGADGRAARGNQVGPAYQEAGGLGALQGLAAGEGDQVETLMEVLGKSPDGGNVRRGVVEDGDRMLLANADPILPLDLAPGARTGSGKTASRCAG